MEFSFLLFPTSAEKFLRSYVVGEDARSRDFLKKVRAAAMDTGRGWAFQKAYFPHPNTQRRFLRNHFGYRLHAGETYYDHGSRVYISPLTRVDNNRQNEAYLIQASTIEFFRYAYWANKKNRDSVYLLVQGEGVKFVDEGCIWWLSNKFFGVNPIELKKAFFAYITKGR